MLRRSFSTRRDTFNVLEIFKGITEGNQGSLARAITMVESRLEEHRQQTEELFDLLCKQEQEGRGERDGKNDSALRIGITGSPGVGKSTLIERLGMTCIEREGMRVATLAIDPTSTISGGSILGDKTRMTQLANHPMGFVRPSPTAGHLGGVARSTINSIYLCEKAGFDVIFVESVGVGQSELALADMIDIFVLCVAPGAGDELQGMKRGITEVADLILVNKAEEPLTIEAQKTIFEYKSAQKYSTSLSRSINRQVLPVSGHTGRGIEVAWNVMKHMKQSLQESGEFEHIRREQMQKWLLSFTKDELLEKFEKSQTTRLRAENIIAEHSGFIGSRKNIKSLLNNFYRENL